MINMKAIKNPPLFSTHAFRFLANVLRKARGPEKISGPLVSTRTNRRVYPCIQDTVH